LTIENSKRKANDSIIGFLLVVVICTLHVFVACSHDESDCNGNAEIALESMIRMPGSDLQVPLGTNDSNAKSNEKPMMMVTLDYDYFMDAHETTCGEFVSVMQSYGRGESFAATFKCEKDSLPIADVTYFDAVLFANAKSLANSFDSVYSYSKATFDEEGHCTELSGFVFHADREGFRLPTEAEWMKAAFFDFNPSNGWNSKNSGYSPHEVCKKDPNRFGFCDLDGNIMEWVNDWLGVFRDTTITNYVGAPDGGELGERVLKGGSFVGSEDVNVYSRGDVYTVTSSTKANYVGFRLAYGAIPNAIWMGGDGVAKASVVNPLASSTDIYQYTKSYSVKLAFRNDVSGSLVYVDYANGFLSFVEISDTIEVYHPEISPDGNKVAFCTRFEGVSGQSSLYVRNLDETGSGLVKLDVESAAIPRWKVMDGDTVITYVTDAGSNKNESAWKDYSTWQVPFTGGKFGNPRKVMDGSFNGGIVDDGSLAVTGAQVLRAFVDGKYGVWYNGEQACNVSLAQDGSKRSLFLDFGGMTGRGFVGKRYDVHQELLVADSVGNLIQFMEAPSGYTFDHSEWALGNTNNNVVATLANADGAHRKIVLLNLAENAIVELAVGDELWHPSLWIKTKEKNEHYSSAAISSSGHDAISSSSAESSCSSESISSTESSSNVESSGSVVEDFEFDPDSAGLYYNTSGACTYALYYRYKMEFLWQFKDSANVVVVGSSRPYNGVVPSLFRKPIVAVNLAVPGGIMSSSKYMLENYVLAHYDKLKAVIISIDLDRGNNIGETSSNVFYTAYSSYLGYVYDQNHNFWRGKDTRGLYEASYEALGSSSVGERLRATAGFLSNEGAGWGEPTVSGDSCWMDKYLENYQLNFDMLVDLITAFQERGVVLVGVIFPMNPKYKETGAFGKYGLRRSEATTIIEDLKKLSAKYPSFVLFDENNMGNHDYTDEMALNQDHLSILGAESLTKRLDSLLQEQDISWGE